MRCRQLVQVSFEKRNDFEFEFDIKTATEVECDIGQLYDLTNRPDVERYGWDGANVEFDVTIM